MPDYVTDTHSLIWCLEDSPRLGRAARECVEACDSEGCRARTTRYADRQMGA
jgi:PIN domain nuclease of toxin-antitoxin system